MWTRVSTKNGLETVRADPNVTLTRTIVSRVLIGKSYVFMDIVEFNEIEPDPSGLQRGDVMIKNPPWPQCWEDILGLKPLPWTQTDS